MLGGAQAHVTGSPNQPPITSAVYWDYVVEAEDPNVTYTVVGGATHDHSKHEPGCNNGILEVRQIPLDSFTQEGRHRGRKRQTCPSTPVRLWLGGQWPSSLAAAWAPVPLRRNRLHSAQRTLVRSVFSIRTGTIRSTTPHGLMYTHVVRRTDNHESDVTMNRPGLSSKSAAIDELYATPWKLTFAAPRSALLLGHEFLLVIESPPDFPAGHLFESIRGARGRTPLLDRLRLGRGPGRSFRGCCRRSGLGRWAWVQTIMKGNGLTDERGSRVLPEFP